MSNTKTTTMAFKLKSGNKPAFKTMGSSPLKTHDGTKSSATHFADGTPKSERDKFNDAETQREMSKVDPDAPGTPGKPGYEPPVKRSDLDKKGKAIYDKHRANPGSGADNTEGQDENKIFDDGGNHIGNWKGDKKVLFKESPAKHATLKSHIHPKSGGNIQTVKAKKVKSQKSSTEKTQKWVEKGQKKSKKWEERQAKKKTRKEKREKRKTSREKGKSSWVTDKGMFK